MARIRCFSACLLCTSVLVANGVTAQAATQLPPNYKYGDLLVKRSYSSWEHREAAPVAAQPNTAPTVIPAYQYTTSPQLMTPVAPSAPPPALSPAPPPAPEMAGHYVSAPLSPPPPPAEVTAVEPALAPGESLPPIPPAAPPLPAASAPAPFAAATPTADTLPADNLTVRRAPLEQQQAAMEASAPMPAFPAAPAAADPLQVPAANEQRYVSGPPVPPHPGFNKQTDNGIVFVGPSGMAEGYKPSWFIAYLSNGYRTDDLDWNIDSSLRGITVPNVLSELEWKNISIYEIKGGAEYTHRDGFMSGAHIEGEGAWGTILSGDNQDSDFLENDRQNEFSRSNNDAGDGDVTSFSMALGWEFSPDLLGRNAHFGITPLVGYQRETQELHMQDGNQTVSSAVVGTPLGPIAGLDSRYETTWNGPFFGTKIGMEWPDHRVAIKGRYIDADYKGKGYWNLRSDFSQDPSFLHEADGRGLAFSANYNWRFYYGLELFLEAAYEKWTADDGIDATFFSNGNEVVTGFNEVNWDSQSYRMGFAYRW